MAGFRAYVENLSSAKAEDVLELSSSESRHLCGALRAKLGDAVCVFDLSGKAFEAELVGAGAKLARLRLIESVRIFSEPVSVSLAQCLPKGGTFEDIINLSVQLGVAKIYPIFSERTIVRLDSSDADKKISKWNSCVVEAIKQSANLGGVKIMSPNNFSDFLKTCSSDTLKLVASLERDKARPILQMLVNAPKTYKEICILIGPEGDLSASEYALAYEAGFSPVSLGKNVLKSEVAAAFALSVAKAFLANS